jgi:hypothetical protein
MTSKRFFLIPILLFFTLFTSTSTIRAVEVTASAKRSPLPAFVWESYVPRTFPEILNSQTMALAGSEPSYLSLDLHRSRVQVVYTGESRPVSEKRAALISAWFTANQADGRYKKLFNNEWLFMADGKEYWLPVQATAADYMSQEFQAGDPVTVLVVLLGASRDRSRLDWLYVVNDVLAE